MHMSKVAGSSCKFNSDFTAHLHCAQLLVLQVNNKLRAAEGETRKMQGVISTEAEAEKCLSGLLERMHRRVTGLVQAAPEVADHRDKELHVAPRVYAMLENYKSEVTQFSSLLWIKLHLDVMHVYNHARSVQAHSIALLTSYHSIKACVILAC